MECPDPWWHQFTCYHHVSILKTLADASGDTLQIPQEDQRGLVFKIGVETHSKVHQELAVLPLLLVLPVKVRKLVA
jgi:hypothetical protein